MHALQDAETAQKAADEKAAQDEVDRQQRIKDSYAAQMPDEVGQKVQAALQKEMVCCCLQRWSIVTYQQYDCCQQLPLQSCDLVLIVITI